MTNRWERKKETSRKKIFESAVALFEEYGFEKTTMEKIASRADMGVGTLYNYYPSKLDLLFSIIEADTGLYIAELDAVIDSCSDLHEAISGFYAIYLKSFSTYGKRVWGELFANMLFKQPDVINWINIIDKQFSDKIKELLTLFQSRGTLCEQADIQVGVSTLYSLLGFHVMLYISDICMTEEELMTSLEKQSALVVRALQK